MKNQLSLILLLFCTQIYSQSITPYIEDISKNEIKNIVYTLSAPEMMGRETGEKGQKDAAQYISAFFRLHQLDSINYSGYEQDFDLYKLDKGEVHLKYNYLLTKNDSTINRRLRSPWIATGDFALDSILTSKYVGYGDDLDNEDLSTSMVILLAKSTMKETHKTVHRLKSENNAKYFIIVSEKSPFIGSMPDEDELLEATDARPFISALNLSGGKYLSENFDKKESALKTISAQLPADVFVSYLPKWYIMRIMGEKTKKLYKAEKKRLKGKDFITYSPKIDTFFCEGEVNRPQKEVINTENIVAYIEGTDLKDEVIVVSGHYDHIGAKNDSTINYGADDNASGTTAVMQVAATLQKAAKDSLRPRRSVICVAFSGEEIGLRGSDFFVNNCPVPLDSVVLNLNMDMIGRNCGKKADSSLSVFLINKGKKEYYTRLTTKSLAHNHDSLVVSTHPGFKEKLTWSVSSDHYRFKKKGIPIACLFTGLHDDYHTPRDTPDKINYEKLTEICRLSTELVWTLANTDKKLLHKHKEEKEGLIEKMMD